MSKLATVQAILEICHDRGIVLNVAGDRLSVDAPPGTLTPDLLDGLKQHKSSLLGLLTRSKSELEAVQCNAEHHNAIHTCITSKVDVTLWDECIEIPDPCPKCSSLMFWWDALGGQHCMMCEKPKFPAEKAAELRELAKQLRQFPKKASFLCRGR
jgi:hypothetical protein